MKTLMIAGAAVLGLMLVSANKAEARGFQISIGTGVFAPAPMFNPYVVAPYGINPYGPYGNGPFGMNPYGPHIAHPPLVQPVPVLHGAHRWGHPHRGSRFGLGVVAPAPVYTIQPVGPRHHHRRW